MACEEHIRRNGTTKVKEYGEQSTQCFCLVEQYQKNDITSLGKDNKNHPLPIEERESQGLLARTFSSQCGVSQVLLFKVDLKFGL